MDTLPAWKIFSASFSQSAEIFKNIFKKTWIVISLLLVASYFFWNSITTGYGSGDMSRSLSIIFYVMFWFSLIPIGICWIEKTITKSEFIFRFDKRIFVSIWYSIIIYLFTIIPIAFSAFVLIALVSESSFSPVLASVIGVCFLFFWASVMMRFSLIMPAIAMNNSKTRLSRSWKLTSGYQFKLLCLLAFPTALLGFGQTILEKLMGTVITTFESFVVVVIVFGVLQIYSAMLIAEIQARIFVFFHVPEKMNEYLKF